MSIMEKKYNLEDFVNENIDLFNTEEPLEGHFDRFKEKLEMQSSSKGKSFVLRSMKYAAAVALVVAAVFIWQNINTSSVYAQSGDDEEFSEIASYYNSQIEIKYEELNTITCKSGSDQKTEVNNDLSELTESYNELQNEFKDDPNNPMIKDALIKNYQMRLDILNMVINTLKNYC